MHDRSFAELDAAAARAAAVLASVGVRRGDVVLLLMSRELEWWDLMLGCIRIGAIASPGTVQSTAKDIAYRATAANARSEVVSSAIVDKATEALEGLSIPQISPVAPPPGWPEYRGPTATR